METKERRKAKRDVEVKAIQRRGNGSQTQRPRENRENKQTAAKEAERVREDVRTIRRPEKNRVNERR